MKRHWVARSILWSLTLVAVWAAGIGDGLRGRSMQLLPLSKNHESHPIVQAHLDRA